MTGSRLAWRTLALALGTLTLVFLATGLTASTASNREAGSFEAALDGARIVEMRVENASTRIETYPGPAVQVRYDLTRAWASARPAVERTGDRLVIRTGCGGQVRVGRDCGGRLDVSLPQGLDLVVVQDVGELQAHGNYRRLDVRVDVGTLTAEDVTAEQVAARSDVGQVYLSLTDPPQSVDASADVGNVVLGLPETDGGYQVQAKTDVGSPKVLIQTNPASARKVTARVDVGNLWVAARGSADYRQGVDEAGKKQGNG